MSRIDSLIAYIVSVYPHKNDLFEERISGILFLADWRSFNKIGQTITAAGWRTSSTVPLSDAILAAAERSSCVGVYRVKSIFGYERTMMFAREDASSFITEHEKTMLDQAIKETEDILWLDFVEYIRKLPPVRRITKSSSINFLMRLISENVY